jgi:hypothetical protein
MAKQNIGYICYKILSTFKKEQNSDIIWINLEDIILREVSQTQKGKIIYKDISMKYLELQIQRQKIRFKISGIGLG